MKNGMVLNSKAAGLDLYEVAFTPKGEQNAISVFVYAKNRLDASNFLILNHIWGEQHSIKVCSVNLMR